MKTLKEQQQEWFEINAPMGKQLGYPDCCIKEFCDQPPEWLKKQGAPSKVDLRRFRAGHINGQFTGFIPCAFHAKEIVTGKITLASLIKDRDIFLPLFPNLA